MAAAAALEAIGTWFISRKAGQETSDAQLLRLFTSRVPGYLRHGLGGTALFLLLAVGTHLGHIEATSSPRDASGRLALVALAAVFGWGGIATLNAIQYWRDIVAYARTGQCRPRSSGGLPGCTTARAAHEQVACRRPGARRVVCPNATDAVIRSAHQAVDPGKSCNYLRILLVAYLSSRCRLRCAAWYAGGALCLPHERRTTSDCASTLWLRGGYAGSAAPWPNR